MFRIAYDFGTSNLGFALFNRKNGQVDSFNMLSLNGAQSKSSSDV